NFVEIAGDFPGECKYVIETLGKVYHNDAITSDETMTPVQRLHFHQANSGPLMEKLHLWLGKQFDDKKVEPNSSLGKAITYMLNHWDELTLFLRVEKAPLDNNICERAIKMAILHRKNSLFYKTEHGAYIGDLFMSLIHTCALSKINPFDYLTALQKNSSALFKNPQQWLPWNYQENYKPSAC
ncbi:MAG: transposase, partial [Desulforhopalus sp.]|nr:transposase [Desulforhopalus sp.]